MNNPFKDINDSVEQEKRNKKVQRETQRILESEPFKKLYEAGVKYFSVYDEIVKNNLESIRAAYHLRADYYKYGKRTGDLVKSKLHGFQYFDENMKAGNIIIGSWDWGYAFKDSEDRDTFTPEWSVLLCYDDDKTLCFICRNHRVDNKKLREVKCKMDEQSLVDGLKKLYKASFE
jgi:hypothetical protein